MENDISLTLSRVKRSGSKLPSPDIALLKLLTCPSAALINNSFLSDFCHRKKKRLSTCMTKIIAVGEAIKKQKTVNRILARLYDSKSVLLATSTGAWK